MHNALVNNASAYEMTDQVCCSNLGFFFGLGVRHTTASLELFSCVKDKFIWNVCVVDTNCKLQLLL